MSIKVQRKKIINQLQGSKTIERMRRKGMKKSIQRSRNNKPVIHMS